MDPLQCLIDAEQAVSDGDLTQAKYLLRAYLLWRTDGGFQPDVNGVRGDVFAAKIARRVAGWSSG